MKRYDDIKAKARKADQELQFIYNEAELGRNLAELTQSGLKRSVQTVTGTVLAGNDVVFRVAIFEKGLISEKDALIMIAQGKTFDENVLILPEESIYLKIWEKKEQTEEESGEEVEE